MPRQGTDFLLGQILARLDAIDQRIDTLEQRIGRNHNSDIRIASQSTEWKGKLAAAIVGAITAAVLTAVILFVQARFS